MVTRLQLPFNSSFNFKMNCSSSLHFAIPLLTFFAGFGLLFDTLRFLHLSSFAAGRVCSLFYETSTNPFETDLALTLLEGLVTSLTRENEFFRLLRYTLLLGSLNIRYLKLKSGYESFV